MIPEPRANCYEKATLSWTEPVVFYRLRGVVKIKEQGGTLRLPFVPPPTALIVFIQYNKPCAVARLRPGAKIAQGGIVYEVMYDEVKWLTDKKPKE